MVKTKDARKPIKFHWNKKKYYFRDKVTKKQLSNFLRKLDLVRYIRCYNGYKYKLSFWFSKSVRSLGYYLKNLPLIALSL